MNAHGCMYHDGHIYVATDGGEGTYASVIKINPVTLNAETIINNFFQQPFNGFNDIDVDPNGNLWVTDSISAWVGTVWCTHPDLELMQQQGRYMTESRPQTTPAVYFINMTTLTPKWVFQTDGNANGIAFAADGTLYIDTTGISSGRPNVKDPYKTRALLAYDTDGGKPQLTNERLFSNSISYYNDGVRVSKNGLVFGAVGDGVDIISPEDGVTLGRIRVAGDDGSLAVNVAFEDHTLWIVGKGGVWRVSNIREQLARDW